MNIKECSEKLCFLLTQSAYVDEANEIDNLVSKILSSNTESNDRKLAINSLISRCHPKWLGDYYIEGITYKEWTDLISLFKTKLARLN